MNTSSGIPTLKKFLGTKGVDRGSLIRLNRYLADNRIICAKMAIKVGSKWHTRQVTSVRGITAVPTSTADFINQRRRWLNSREE